MARLGKSRRRAGAGVAGSGGEGSREAGEEAGGIRFFSKRFHLGRTRIFFRAVSHPGGFRFWGHQLPKKATGAGCLRWQSVANARIVEH